MSIFRFNKAVLLTILHLFFLLAVTLTAYGQELRVDNTAKYVGSGTYEWTVFLLAEESILDNIKYVEYRLHPSFPNPIQRIDNRESDFALSARGWGEFNIFIKIIFKDGRSTNLKHWLRLEERSKEEIEIKEVPLDQHGKITTKNTSKYIGKDQWEWKIFIVSDDETLDEVECVEYTLHPTFPDPIKKICRKGPNSRRGFFLTAKGWGTFTIGVKIIFKDGGVRYLKHKLIFSEKKKRAR